MDLQTKETGGDLGWLRRGENLPEFDAGCSAARSCRRSQPGQLSPVVETPHGYHIVRVDRVQPGEVKAHQISIVPKMDSADIARAQTLADSVGKLLQERYAVRYARQEVSRLRRQGRDEHSVAVGARQFADDVSEAFAARSRATSRSSRFPARRLRPDVPKFVVAQLLRVDEGGRADA